MLFLADFFSQDTSSEGETKIERPNYNFLPKAVLICANKPCSPVGSTQQRERHLSRTHSGHLNSSLQWETVALSDWQQALM